MVFDNRINLSSRRPRIGKITIKIIKYTVDAICVIKINGCSAGSPPNQVSSARSAIRIQNVI